MGHLVNVVIIITYKYMYLGLGSQYRGEQTLDQGQRNLGSNSDTADHLLSNKKYFFFFSSKLDASYLI